MPIKYIIFLAVLVIIIAAGLMQKYWFLPRPANLQSALQEQNENNGDQAIVNPVEPQVKIEILKPGNGSEAKNGDKLQVYYVGTLENGQQFDSNVGSNQPFEFTLGAGQVIQGWENGLLGMKVGEKRKLTIPPDLGYGQQGAGDKIPPNSTLIFEVELLKIN